MGRRSRRSARPGRFRLQGEGDLGDRIARAVATAFHEKIRRVLVIGADCPTATADVLGAALDALKSHDVVVGPATDGGYYLIGFNRDAYSKKVFDGISWGTEKVFTETLDNIEDAGLTVHTLPQWRDIDTYADLKAFYEKAVKSGQGALRTVQYLNKIFKAPDKGGG